MKMGTRINVKDAQKWIRVHVEKGVARGQGNKQNGKAGLEAFAGKFGCKATEESVRACLEIIFRQDVKRRERVLKTLIKNDQNMSAKRAKVLDLNAAIQETTTESSDAEFNIQEVLGTLRDSLDWHSTEMTACVQNLDNMQKDLENILKQVNEISRKLVSLEKQKKAVLWKVSNENTRKIELESKISEITEKIAELERQEIENTALRLTLYEECVGEKVTRANLEGISDEDISQKSFMLMTSNEFPKEFLELRGECISWNETRCLATMLLVSGRNDKKVYWYLPKGSSLADLLTYLGENVVEAQ